MTTTATFHAYFGYRDAVTALRWLEKAFGFETSMEVPDGKGGIMHAEMRYGGVAFTLFTDEQGYDRPTRKGETVGHGMYVAFDTQAEVDAMFAQATAAGADVVWKPELTEWGNYRFRVADPEGCEWTFGTHRPGR
ncbi:VOC family protein [Kribbella sp. NPDC051936]|uniref:VOC family protein n=1 Tax=Kribbella sp. NPDC051936 TaxID=3154946 RepID=UPI00343F5F08